MPLSECRGRRAPGEAGAVLLEVLLALALFVGAAAVITGALSSSIDSVERLRSATHAMNLSASVVAELQMGVRAAVSAGPEPFEAPFEDWIWEIVVGGAPGDGVAGGVVLAEVIVRNLLTGVTRRLAQALPAAGSGEGEEIDWFASEVVSGARPVAPEPPAVWLHSVAVSPAAL